MADFMGDLLSWIENTNLARAIGSSVGVTASLSAIHVIGFTLGHERALLANLRALGALFHARAVAAVRPASKHRDPNGTRYQRANRRLACSRLEQPKLARTAYSS
jgi:hypothetical protein